MLTTYSHLAAWSLLSMEVYSTEINEIASKFQQSDYKITFEWAEAVHYNKKNVKYLQVVAFKHNRTCAAFNLTCEYNVDVGNDVEVTIQFASNEYMLFPLRLQVNFCFAVSKNLIGAQAAYKCGNFTGCPTRKGQRVHICNFVPDENQFPPFIPNGRYMLETQATYRSKELFTARFYGSVTRPLV